MHLYYSQTTIELVRNNTQAYLANVHGIEQPTKRHFRCLRPGHEDRHPSMILNPRSNRLHCFGCNVDVDVFDVAGWDAGVTTFPEKVRAAAKGAGIAIDEAGTAPMRTTAAPASSPASVLPPKPIDCPDVLDNVEQAVGLLFEPCGAKALDYLHNRGFANEDIVGAGIGWCGHPSDVMPGKLLGVPRTQAGYVCIPYPDDPLWSSVTYCVFRPVDRTSRIPKELKPGGLPAMVYREHLLRDPGAKVYVTEGPLDALALSLILCTTSTCAIGGGGPTRLLAALAHTPPHSRPSIVLAYDCDAAGEQYTITTKAGLVKLGIPCTVLEPYPFGAKDPNELLKLLREEAHVA